jgi:hypothetical protein
MTLDELKEILLDNIKNQTYNAVIEDSENAVKLLEEIFVHVEFNMPDQGTWSHWTVGCETDPDSKRWLLQNPRHWRSWNCGDKETASYLRWIIDKEMFTQGGSLIAPSESTYVYCYLNT